LQHFLIKDFGGKFTEATERLRTYGEEFKDIGKANCCKNVKILPEQPRGN
jgi:hypothetical protein